MQDKRRQIIALGGGGCSMEPENLALDRYILAQACISEPAVAFVPTASGDSDNYVVRFYTAYGGLPCRPSHLPFFRRTPDLRSYLLAQDVIYVGGGNTKSMLAVWREWSLPQLLREADDGAAIHFVSNQVYRVVASRAGATAYRVHATGIEVREEPLPVERL